MSSVEQDVSHYFATIPIKFISLEVKYIFKYKHLLMFLKTLLNYLHTCKPCEALRTWVQTGLFLTGRGTRVSSWHNYILLNPNRQLIWLPFISKGRFIQNAERLLALEKMDLDISFTIKSKKKKKRNQRSKPWTGVEIFLSFKISSQVLHLTLN